MVDITKHRKAFLRDLGGCEGRGLCRDVAVLETPWGSISSRAIYRHEKASTWTMVVDEFGDPTDAGRKLYESFRTMRPVETIVRLTNKNQLLLGRESILQLSPLSWTTRFLELSALYDLLRRLPSGDPHLSLQGTNGISPFFTLVELAWRGKNRRDTLHDLRKRAKKLGGLPVELQALLFVCDSDLGKESSPFLEVESWHPASLNRLSRWRCWASLAATEDIFALLVPPVAFAGEDIYRRAIWGPSPQARVQHICAAEASLRNLGASEVYRVNYEEIWKQLLELCARARRDRDLYCQFAAGVFRDEFVHSTLRRIEFWLKFWSHHMQEVLVLGDMPLERVFEVEMIQDGPITVFNRAPAPMWTAGQRITSSQRLKHWMLPFCAADDQSESDETPRREIRNASSKGVHNARKP